MSKLLYSPAQIVASFKSAEYHLHIDETEGRKGRCVRHTAGSSSHERNIIPLNQWDLSAHLSDGYVTDYFGHSNSGYPQEARDQQGPLFPSSPPTPTPPTLVFPLLSYREWGPL